MCHRLRWPAQQSYVVMKTGALMENITDLSLNDLRQRLLVATDPSAQAEDLSENQLWELVCFPWRSRQLAKPFLREIRRRHVDAGLRQQSSGSSTWTKSVDRYLPTQLRTIQRLLRKPDDALTPRGIPAERAAEPQVQEGEVHRGPRVKARQQALQKRARIGKPGPGAHAPTLLQPNSLGLIRKRTFLWRLVRGLQPSRQWRSA